MSAYICPNGKLLKTSGTVHDGRTLLYRASKRDCVLCPIRAKGCTTADAGKIPREAVLNCIKRVFKEKFLMVTLFNFGMVFFVPQLFIFGFWSMGKIIALKKGLVPKDFRH